MAWSDWRYEGDDVAVDDLPVLLGLVLDVRAELGDEAFAADPDQDFVDRGTAHCGQQRLGDECALLQVLVFGPCALLHVDFYFEGGSGRGEVEEVCDHIFVAA